MAIGYERSAQTVHGSRSGDRADFVAGRTGLRRPYLEFRLLGDFAIHSLPSGKPLDVPREVRLLLSYLLLSRDVEHTRDELCRAIWPGQEASRANSRCKRAIGQLRKAFAAAGFDPDAYIIAAPAGQIAFDRSSNYWMDVDALEALGTNAIDRADGALASFGPDALEAIVRLYAGDILRGFDLEWICRARERYLALYVDSLICLAEYYRAHGDLATSIECAEMAVARQPLREDIHRGLIALHAVQGQRHLALRQYKICKAILEIELGIAPTPETDATLERALTRPKSCGGAQWPRIRPEIDPSSGDRQAPNLGPRPWHRPTAGNILDY